jgi:protein involved in sex pheromone biosynthesis
MKKVIALLTIGLFLILASCSKEDDPIDNSFAVNPITNKVINSKKLNCTEAIMNLFYQYTFIFIHVF